MSTMEGAIEYRDTWRGLRILVPEGWQVRRSERGLLLHDGTGLRAIVAEPRPGATLMDGLQEDLLAWLRRFDPGAQVDAEPDGPTQTRACTASLTLAPGLEEIGVFAQQLRPAGGFISGFLAPVTTYEADCRTAVAALATLAPLPALSRSLWREPSENACSAWIPRGWRAAGHVNRSSPSGMATTSFHAWADEWTGVVASAESRLFSEPRGLSGLLGSHTNGPAAQGRFVDAAGFAETYLLPALREEAPDAQIEAIIPRPDLVPLAVARQAAGGLSLQQLLQCSPTGAEIVLSFHAGGRELRQISRVLTMRVPAAVSRGLPLWVATIPHSYRAPVERFAEWAPVLEGVGLSFRVDAGWQEKEQSRAAGPAGRAAMEKVLAADPPALLADAERLVAEGLGRPLGLHERPFAAGFESSSGERSPANPVLGLYEESIWRGVDVRA